MKNRAFSAFPNEGLQFLRSLKRNNKREWFQQRAGQELPASVELMLQASSRSTVELARLLVLQTPTAAVADGILQHPATRQHIVRRIGPTSLAVSPESFDALKDALQEMGVEIKDFPE